MSKGILQPPPP